MRKILRLGNRVVGFPPSRYFCPVCDRKVWQWRGLLRISGDGEWVRESEKRLCPHCHTLERTRHFVLWIEQEGILDKRPRTLHFAPEKGLREKLRAKLGEDYVTTDLMMDDVDEKQDITSMTFDSGTFGFIYCSNVLEHVEDDRTAMSELFRVLSPGGIAVVQVPLRPGTTYEDSTIRDPEQRFKHFGQADHVRWYGPDIEERLSEAGFEVRPFRMLDVLKVNESDVERMNLGKMETVFRCQKPE